METKRADDVRRVLRALKPSLVEWKHLSDRYILYSPHPLKPSLVEWKPPSVKQDVSDPATLKPSLVEWKP